MIYDKFAYYEDRAILVKLINNEGEILDKEGYAVEGGGIFDEEGEEYIAGYDERGEMYASVVDSDDTVLNLEGERTRYKLSSVSKTGSISDDEIDLLREIADDETGEVLKECRPEFLQIVKEVESMAKEMGKTQCKLAVSREEIHLKDFRLLLGRYFLNGESAMKPLLDLVLNYGLSDEYKKVFEYVVSNLSEVQKEI